MAPIRPIENKDISHIIEQDQQCLIQGSSRPYLIPLTLFHNHQNREIMIHHHYLNLIHIFLPPYLNSQVRLITILLVSSKIHVHDLHSNLLLLLKQHLLQHIHIAQKTSDSNISTTFNINMIHTNPSPNIVTSRKFSRPLLQTFPNNRFYYNLSSVNTHITQHSLYSLEQNAQINPSKTCPTS